jgi:macrodomain Ter protein organizer (MatP/YcbG family)
MLVLIIYILFIILVLYYKTSKKQNELQTLVDLQNKQVEIASKIYNNDMKPELKNALDFILQNIPPTTDIISKSF